MFAQLPKNIPHHSKKNTINPSYEKYENLQLSELRYRRLFETAQDGILILDASTGKIADANPFLLNLLSYSETEILGKQLWQIGVFKDIVDSKKAFTELKSNGYIRYKDLPLQTKDGRLIDVEFVSNVYVVGNEKVIQCNIRDITDRRQVEQKVDARTKKLEELARFQEETKKAMLNVMEDLGEAKNIIEVERAKDEAMLTSIGEGVIAVDNNLRIMVINKSAEKMLGYKRKYLIGKKVTSLPLEDESGLVLPFAKRPTFKTLASGKRTSGFYYFIRKDKSRFPTAINITPVRLRGKIIGTINIFRDITREREVDRAKSEFVSLASHQLRTPLGISKWYLESLLGKDFLGDMSEKVKDYLGEVYKSNERLLNLVRSLLSASRIDQGTIRDVPELIDMSKLIKDVIREMNIIASKKQIRLNLKLKSLNIPKFFIDPLKIHQVIENLISNGIEYSNPKTNVEITVDKKDKKILISVKDSGIGISSSDQKMLFTKFFRSPQATTKNTEGSGLGLYIVRAYLQGWGGEIFVKSTEGKGSVFTIILPFIKK